MSQAPAAALTQGQGQPQLSAIAVRRADLPLPCPGHGAELWSLHPRVYLPIAAEPTRESVCPYCSARYRLVD